MKKIIIYIIVTVIIFKAVVPTFRFEYYYSKDRLRVLTRVIWGNTWILLDRTYFTPGHYSRWWFPEIYVMPIRSGHGLWIEEVTLHDKGIFICGTPVETKNLNSEFQYHESSFFYYRDALRLDSLQMTFKNPVKYKFDTIKESTDH